MKIAMINGSPKAGPSNSEFLLQKLTSFMAPEHEIQLFQLNVQLFSLQQYVELCHMDCLVFAFPLYIDALPSHVLRMLISLEKYMKSESHTDIFVYAMINNGFFEGRQNHVALEILENWCLRANIHFGQGICQGAGEMMGSIKRVPLNRGPFKKLDTAMKKLAANIQSRNSADPLFLNPGFPRFAWKFIANHQFWNGTAKRNGLQVKDILRK